MQQEFPQKRQKQTKLSIKSGDFKLNQCESEKKVKDSTGKMKKESKETSDKPSARISFPKLRNSISEMKNF